MNKKNRLTKRKEFGYIYKNGKKLSTPALMVIYITTKLNHPRFGFVVNKKLGKAHMRNKIKRQFREIVRTHLDQFSPKLNYIFVAKPDILTLSFTQKTELILQIKDQINTAVGE